MNDAPEMHARPKIVGARIKRTEDPRLLTGLGAYTDDRQVMRVLHVAFRRSDQAHARIRSIDCSAARAAPGVVAVLTAEDLSAAVQPLVATSRMPNYYPTPLLPLAHTRYAMSASRWSASSPRAATTPRTPSSLSPSTTSRWLQSSTRAGGRAFRRAAVA